MRFLLALFALTTLAFGQAATPRSGGVVNGQQINHADGNLFLDPAVGLYAPDGTTPWIDSSGNNYLSFPQGIASDNAASFWKLGADGAAEFVSIYSASYSGNGSGLTDLAVPDPLYLQSGAISIGDNTGSVGSWDAGGNLIANSLAGDASDLTGSPVLDAANMTGSPAFDISNMIGTANFSADGMYGTPSFDLSSCNGDLSSCSGAPALDASNFTNLPAETDPVVGNITGLIKANGLGTISAAEAGTDYLAPNGDAGALSVNGLLLGYLFDEDGISNYSHGLASNSLAFFGFYGGKLKFETDDIPISSQNGDNSFDNSGFHGTGTVIAGTKTATGTATTTYTVTIGVAMANTTYKVVATPGNVLSAAVFYVNNKSPTTFDVVYLSGLTGSVAFDWIVTP